ncbi:MAG: M56 family metallopeptidase, partial [Phycisphaerae bacterium]
MRKAGDTRGVAFESTAQTPSPATASVSDRAQGASQAAVARDAVPGATWQAWLAGMRSIRAAVVRLPSLPSGVWLGGTAIVVLVGGLRTLRFRRWVLAGRVPPRSVLAMVAEAADGLGLRRVPETLMIDARSSPMICCGRRARLLLPVKLWSQLDHAGRRAVIGHELAHVRRRDHWVRWIEIVLASVYWWHPLMWWVRRRIDAEAELCCDAWVTWLWPAGRRAYAEALLTTKQYVNDHEVAVPAVGIGVTTGRAGRFARRITMVMTEQVAPRMSMRGVVLGLALGVIGWVTTPAWSCPDKDRITVTKVKLSGTAHAKCVVCTTCPRCSEGVTCSTCAKCAECTKCSTCAKCAKRASKVAKRDKAHEKHQRKAKRAKKARRGKRAKKARTVRPIAFLPRGDVFVVPEPAPPVPPMPPGPAPTAPPAPSPPGVFHAPVTAPLAAGVAPPPAPDVGFLRRYSDPGAPNPAPFPFVATSD